MTEALGVDLTSPRLRRLHSFWIEKRQADRLPGSVDFDPFTFTDLLPWIILHDVIDLGGHRRYRIRMEGTEVAKLFGTHRSGKWLDAVFPTKDAERIQRAYDTVVESRKPRTWRTHVTLPSGEVLHYTRLLMPLSSDGTTVDRLFGMLEFERPAEKTGTAPAR
jgi:hypothetical protein